MEQFTKYCAGVYCLQTDKDNLEHGEAVEVTTRRGKTVTVIVWKKVLTKNGASYYSYIREDGLDRKGWQARKVERLQNAAERQRKLSDMYFNKSNEHRDFLSLCEPIKVGHHSEKRHRRIIEQAYNNMGKSVAADEKAKDQLGRAAEIESRLSYEINLDTPDSIPQLMQRLDDLEAKRECIKSRAHESWELSNLRANIRRYKQRLATAWKLWDLTGEPLPEDKAPKKRPVKEKPDYAALIEKHGGFWAFNQQQFDERAQEGTKYVRLMAGLVMPKENVPAFKAEAGL